MGRVTEKIKLSNFVEPEKSVEVEALIDTGAMMLVLPQNIVDELGLRKMQERTVRYADYRTKVRSIYGGVIVDINGRSDLFSVIAEAKGTQPLVGQIVLEQLDLIVDPVARKVLPNPRAADMLIVDLLAAGAATARGKARRLRKQSAANTPWHPTRSDARTSKRRRRYKPSTRASTFCLKSSWHAPWASRRTWLALRQTPTSFLWLGTSGTTAFCTRTRSS